MAKAVAALQSHREKGRKRPLPHSVDDLRPEKKSRPLLEVDTSEEENESISSGGVALNSSVSPINQNGFTINQDFARRFEHNKKREELQKRSYELSKSYPVCVLIFA